MIFHDRIQKLCRNEFVRPAYLDINTKCIYLHHRNPYLKLGPFKYDLLNEVPHIAMLRDFASTTDVEKTKSVAAGNMKSTPLMVQHNP